MEPEFIDEERVPLLHRDDDIDDSVYDDSVYEDSQAETSFNNDDVIQQEANEIDREINALERGFNV